MQARVKRGILSAFFINILMPYGAFFYVRKPVYSLLAILFSLGMVAVVHFFYVLDSFLGFTIVFGSLSALLLISTLVAMRLAHKGLSPEKAQADIGPYFVAYLLISLATTSIFPHQDYKSYVASSSSVAPAVLHGEYLVARLRNNTSVWGDSAASLSFRPGDIVLLENAAGVSFLRRLVGVPGDMLEFREGWLYRNGKKLLAAPHISLPDDSLLLQVPAGACLVLGNIPQGEKLVQTGFLVRQEEIKGKALYRYWSNSLGRLGTIRAD